MTPESQDVVMCFYQLMSWLTIDSNHKIICDEIVKDRILFVLSFSRVCHLTTAGNCSLSAINKSTGLFIFIIIMIRHILKLKLKDA